MVDLGAKLKELREEQGFSQRQVSMRVGVSSSMISAYESGSRQPSYEVLIKLTRLYKVSADYLLGISGQRTAAVQYSVSLDGLTPSRIALVEQLIKALKE